MLEELTLEFQRRPNPADSMKVAEGLFDALSAQVGNRRRDPFALILRRQDGTVAGGLVGKVLFNDVHVDQLWLHASVRARGYGRKLMEEAEVHAVREGCQTLFLNTMNPRVLRFYLGIGYYEIGRITDFPVGQNVYFLRKDL